MVTVLNYRELLPPSPAPSPSPETIALFATYDHPFPGVQSQAPGVQIATISPEVSLTTSSKIDLFFDAVYSKLKPNTYTSVGLLQIVQNDSPNIGSAIYNFYSIDDNVVSEIIPPSSAQPLNAVLKSIEKTYNEQALNYLLSIFNTHTADVIDNPHHDATLYDPLNDFLNVIYTALVSATGRAFGLDGFIASKTKPVFISTVASFNTTNFPSTTYTLLYKFLNGSSDQTQGNVVITTNTSSAIIFPNDPSVVTVPASVYDTIFALHKNSTDITIHDNFFLNNFYVYTNIPEPLFVINPDTAFLLTPLPMITDGSLTGITASLAINVYFQSLYNAILTATPTTVALPSIGVIDASLYYDPYLITDGFPHSTGTLFVQAQLDTTNTNACVLVFLTSTYGTADTIMIIKPPGSYSLYVEVFFNGQSTITQLTNIGGSIMLALTFDSTGFRINYIDVSGSYQMANNSISNFVLDIDRIQLGAQVTIPTATAQNAIQQIITYPVGLDSNTIATLFQTPLH